jgi:hypothetical protein
VLPRGPAGKKQGIIEEERKVSATLFIDLPDKDIPLFP